MLTGVQLCPRSALCTAACWCALAWLGATSELTGLPDRTAAETLAILTAILYYTILYYTILYYTILYYTILYYTMFIMCK